MVPYGAIAIPLCVALLAVTLRRVHGLRYGMAVLCLVGLSFGVMRWLPDAQKRLWVFIFALFYLW